MPRPKPGMLLTFTGIALLASGSITSVALPQLWLSKNLQGLGLPRRRGDLNGLK